MTCLGASVLLFHLSPLNHIQNREPKNDSITITLSSNEGLAGWQRHYTRAYKIIQHHSAYGYHSSASMKKSTLHMLYLEISVFQIQGHIESCVVFVQLDIDGKKILNRNYSLRLFLFHICLVLFSAFCMQYILGCLI